MGAALEGVCSSDIFQELKNKYGKEFVKLIIAEKAKDAVRTKFGQIGIKLDTLFAQGKTQADSLVDQKVLYVTDLFNQLKIKLDSTVPGGIKVVELYKGQSIEEIVGFNKLVGVIRQIQTRALSEFNNKQGVIVNELRTKQQNFIQKIDDNKPKLPLYDQLPQVIQRQILHKGEEMFISQAEAKQKEIMDTIDNEISFDKVKDVITRLIPSQELNSVVGGAQNQFSGVLGTLLTLGGASSSGSLGQVIGALGGLFGSSPSLGVGNPAANTTTTQNNRDDSPIFKTASSMPSRKKEDDPTSQGLAYRMNDPFM